MQLETSDIEIIENANGGRVAFERQTWKETVTEELYNNAKFDIAEVTKRRLSKRLLYPKLVDVKHDVQGNIKLTFKGIPFVKENIIYDISEFDEPIVIEEKAIQEMLNKYDKTDPFNLGEE